MVITAQEKYGHSNMMVLILTNEFLLTAPSLITSFGIDENAEIFITSSNEIYIDLPQQLTVLILI